MRLVGQFGVGVAVSLLGIGVCLGQTSPTVPAPEPPPVLIPTGTAPPPAIAPLTIGLRAKSSLRRALGPESFGLGILTSGIQTWRGRPEAWGSDWEGFAQRFGMRMSRSVLSNGIDFGLGAALGTDPRYRRLGHGGFGGRLKYAFKASFYHYDSEGRRVPAVSRFAGIVGSNVIVNHWMPPGDNLKSDVARRCGQQVAWHIGWNVFREFLPDIKRKLGR